MVDSEVALACRDGGLRAKRVNGERVGGEGFSALRSVTGQFIGTDSGLFEQLTHKHSYRWRKTV
jgi:hypothetical protein